MTVGTPTVSQETPIIMWVRANPVLNCVLRPRHEPSAMQTSFAMQTTADHTSHFIFMMIFQVHNFTKHFLTWLAEAIPNIPSWGVPSPNFQPVIPASDSHGNLIISGPSSSFLANKPYPKFHSLSQWFMMIHDPSQVIYHGLSHGFPMGNVSMISQKFFQVTGAHVAQGSPGEPLCRAMP